MNYYIISFRGWRDFVKGLNIASKIGTVDCKPNWTIIVSDNQLEAINNAEVKYDNGTRRETLFTTQL